MLRLRQDIPLFPGGRKKAFTLSSDDGVTQDTRLTELMRKYGIKGTFHLNSGLMGDRDWLIQPGIDVSHYKLRRDEIKEVYDGFEIAVHTMTHPDLTTVPSSMAAWEISENKRDLETLAGHPISGMSYPFGTYNDSVLETVRLCGILYSRTVITTDAFRLPENFLTWHPTCHYCADNRMELAEKFLEENAAEEYLSPSLFYVWGHAYQLDAYQDWEGIENFFARLGNKEDIWYASNIEICQYILAVRSLVYSSTGDYIFNPTCTDVWLMIDGRPYQIPSGKTVSIPWKHTND